MRIFVLGSTGMLGSYVSRYLKSRGFGVADINRDSIDAAWAKKEDLANLNPVKGDVFINCMGVIKQRGKTPDDIFVRVNGAFPHMVADFCVDNGINFIHVTTDCVFNGFGSMYGESDFHDAEDIYGKSKSIGEPSNVTVIRTSIIGEEKHNKASLLEWVKSKKGQTIKGYTNHLWNGITCLQFAKVCEYIINNDMFWRGIKHVHSPDMVSKYELVKMISDVYDLDITVEPMRTELRCDRSLSTEDNIFVIEVPPLEEQLIDLRKFGV